ncbi:hypothetical protein TRVA0_001S08680 [Trichomonascus vanleenenianus]|uniref:E3 ubiquitin-protein ligase IRC20 n=1 Tax=Trichomonascus vanleenenianus TaxID=2268995 RepID=UPI003EC9E56B
MDSDTLYKLDRPHITDCDVELLGKLVAETGTPVNGIAKTDDSVDLVPVLSNSIDLGLYYPLESKEYPKLEIEKGDTVLSADVELEMDENDPTRFEVKVATKKRRKGSDLVSTAHSTLFKLHAIKFRQIRMDLLKLESLGLSKPGGRGLIHYSPPRLEMVYIGDAYGNMEFTGTIRYCVSFVAKRSLPIGVAMDNVTFKRLDILLESNPKKATVQDFYECVSKDRRGDVNEKMVIPGMSCELLKFQMGTVKWLLNKEGKKLDSSGKLVGLTPEEEGSESEQVYGWHPINDDYWVNTILGVVCTKEVYRQCVAEFNREYQRGAKLLLAEEMGLGKTIETLSVVLLNKFPAEQKGTMPWDDVLERNLPAVKTTLIVCPETIADQWIGEIQTHTPTLTVRRYFGRGKKDYSTGEELSEYDIVVTTYQVISAELPFVQYDPEVRNVRSHVVQKRRDVEGLRSPLVQQHFWRVILDEVQMVGSRASHCATVATTIPRAHAWGITGTPIKGTLTNLKALVSFLRYEPFATRPRIWDRLTRHVDEFRRFWSNSATRHTLSMVQEDIKLPEQHHVLVPLRLNVVEENGYEYVFKNFIRSCNLDAYSEGFKYEHMFTSTATNEMSFWLQRLRQICGHAAIGQRSTVLQMQNASTTAEILDGMLDQIRSDYFATYRKLQVNKLSIGQSYDRLKNTTEALKWYSKTTKEVEDVIKDNWESPERLRKIKDNTATSSIRFRSWVELLHRCYFFVATAHYRIRAREEAVDENGEQVDPDLKPKPKDEELIEREKLLEEEYYGRAESLRQIMLSSSIERAMYETDRLSKLYIFSDKFDKSAIVRIGSRLKSHVLFTQLNLLEQKLNDQLEMILEFATEVKKNLTTRLVEQSNEATGEEYEASLDSQEYAFQYLTVLQKAIVDRQFAVTGTDLSISHKNSQKEKETKETKKRKRQKVSDDPDALESQLEQKRMLMRPLHGQGTSLRGIWLNLQQYSGQDAQSGSEIHTGASHLHEIVTSQTKLIDHLKRDVTLFNTCYNSRLEYYRQLQALSDQVTEDPLPEADVVDETKETQRIASTKLANAHLEREIRKVDSRVAYLDGLRIRMNSDGAESKICTICDMEIEWCVWTSCGHEFCLPCMNAWNKHSRSCPMCRTKLGHKDLYRYKVNAGKKQIKPEYQDSVDEPSKSDTEEDAEILAGHIGVVKDEPIRSAVNRVYRTIHKSTLDEINSAAHFKDNQRFGSKIDHIVAAVIWLRSIDPNTQVVIFSLWSSMLDKIAQALRRNKIEFTMGKEGTARFTHDPNVACYLLHTKSQSAGLTLVNATHLFLVEPVLHPDIELQAISRIHRIGQTRPTTVWSFVMEDTVEVDIMEIACEQRLQHRNDNEQLTEQDKVIIEASKEGGETVDSDVARDILYRQIERFRNA